MYVSLEQFSYFKSQRQALNIISARFVERACILDKMIQNNSCLLVHNVFSWIVVQNVQIVNIVTSLMSILNL